MNVLVEETPRVTSLPSHQLTAYRHVYAVLLILEESPDEMD